MLFLLILLSGIIRAELVQVNAWNNFEGKLGNSDMQLSIYLFKDGQIKGNYIIKYTGTKIQLSGERKAGSVILTEYLNNLPGRTFRGKIFTDTVDKFEGIWRDPTQNESLNFSTKLVFFTAGIYDHRYTDVLGTTGEVEEFIKKVRSSILVNDKEWISEHIHYPLKHLSGKGFSSINSSQELITFFDEIFSKKFKDRIRQYYTTNLFTKNGSVMLGNGEIWISNTANSTKDKYAFNIITINP
jgi:hypothetical protein